MNNLLKTTVATRQYLNLTRRLTTSLPLFLDQSWRLKKGLPANPNEFGVLTNYPDYSFVDGRPTPIGSNQKKRLLKQKEFAVKIVTMCKELDYAKDRFAKIQQEKKLQKDNVLKGKLQPKGPLLLKKQYTKES